ncbi:phosphatase PAP2 family protein [Streptomyces bambusae]|uniref:phosphatase PAP2 family protein n=1 Tax=Streptomyces bambusae TaxID=1550616 RepID=UPI001D00138F|nr:phosphatase PAP2 family protein [Streptomyces bambusae]MCB5170400.1 phosphatase PAP2 family protein [Streptomyces bambusae]
MDTSALYRDVIEFAHDTPGWFQTLAEVWTEAGLLLFGGMFVFLWWRARRLDDGALALAVLAPLATAVGYVASESLKSVVDEDRPCRAVAGALAPLVECPPVGDWSFPSNHSAIAGAAAIALAMTVGRLALLTVPMALLMAFSRVFVGVHYPHDVAMGLILGGSMAALAMVALTGPTSRIVRSVRAGGAAGAVWFTGPGPAR